MPRTLSLVLDPACTLAANARDALVFAKQARFQPLYEAIVRTAVHVVKAEHVATFLGHKITANYQGEVGNDFSTRIQGTRIRHHLGPASISKTKPD